MPIGVHCSVFSVRIVRGTGWGEERTGEWRDRVGQDRHDVSEQVVEVEDDGQPAHAHRHQHQHEQPVDKHTNYVVLTIPVFLSNALRDIDKFSI